MASFDLIPFVSDIDETPTRCVNIVNLLMCVASYKPDTDTSDLYKGRISANKIWAEHKGKAELNTIRCAKVPFLRDTLAPVASQYSQVVKLLSCLQSKTGEAENRL